MTQTFGENGNVIPITIVKAGEGVVVQVKQKKKDGYNAVQFGFNEGSKNVNKPVSGHVKGMLDRPVLREMRVDDASSFSAGQKFGLANFAAGEKVSVSGISKGQGFAGVVKRHGFHGGPKTHGNKHSLRSGGSIGSTDSARVFPGMRMPGKMGATRITVSNLEIIEVDPENGLIKIKGAVPGARNGLVEIRGQGDMIAAEDKGLNSKAEGQKEEQPEKAVKEEKKKEEEKK